MSMKRMPVRKWLAISLTVVLLLALLAAAGAALASRGEDALADEPARVAAADLQPRTVTYTYDDAGRLVGAVYGEGQGIAYTYDAAGNLLGREVYGMPTPTPTAVPTATPTATPIIELLYLPITVRSG